MSDFDVERLIDSVVRPISSNTPSLIDALTQAWVSERTAPEILPHQTVLLETVTNQLKDQIALIEDSAIQDAKMSFKLVIVQTELERIKYLIRSYLRTRLYKIDRYSLLCLRDTSIMGKLSTLERQYAEKHQAILERHYYLTFLKDLPGSGHLRKLDDTAAAGLSMIEQPDLKKAIFCKVTKKLQSAIFVGSERIEAEIGNVLLLQYDGIRKFVYDESIVLI